jgi:DNA-directed RNA polymerase specialized sigma24 family protein
MASWFYRLLHNAVIDHYRRRAAEQRALEALVRDPRTATEEE